MGLSVVVFLFISFALVFGSSIHSTIAFDQCGVIDESSELSLIHIYGKCSPFNPPSPSSSWVNTVMTMASKDPQRLNYLSSLVGQKPTSAQIASGQQVLNIGNYLVRAKIGSPGQLMFMVFDTSSDAAFVPCSGCTGCSSTTFDPSKSNTYEPVDCSLPECAQVRGLSCPTTGAASCLFNRTYGDSSFSATLSRDSLTLGSDVVPNFGFGCVGSISGKKVPPQGLLGLGRGPMSLLSQSGSLYSSVFSYCLPSFKSYYFSGSLKLGPLGQHKKTKTTPLLQSPHRPSLYYVNLTGVSVGDVAAPIAPELLKFDPNTGVGTIIDSGTILSRFQKPVYEAIRDEFRKQVTGPFTSLGVFDTCFPVTAEEVPPVITLHFTGLDLGLPTENTLIHSSSGSLACLAMAASPSYSELNVIASLQQQNFRVLFDTANSLVGITREICN